MTIESPIGSDLRLEPDSLGAALRRRMPRILLVTALLLAATYLVLPFIPVASVPAIPAPAAEAPSAPVPAAPATADPQLAALQQQVTDADSKVADFKIANDLYSNGAAGSPFDQQLGEAQSQIAAVTAQRDAATADATLIRGLLDANQPIDSIDDIRNSITIQQLEQQKGQLVAQRAQLLATFLPGHPGIVTATAQIASIDKQIVTEAGRVADALDAQAAIETKGIVTLQQTLGDLKSKQAGEARNGVTLDALQRDATAARAELQGYLGRYGATDDATQPAASGSAPAYATSPRPTGRNNLLILLAVGVLALAVQIGAVVLLTLFARYTADRAVPFEDAVDDSDRPEETHREPVQSTMPSMAAVAPVTPPAAAAPPEPAPASVASPPQNLRRWFMRHAHAADDSDEIPATEEAAAPVAPALSQEPPVAAAAPQPAPHQPEAVDPQTAAAIAAAGARALDNLASDMILGRASVVVLASLEEAHESEMLAERLASDALEHGLSVAHVDAASGRQSTEPGITDLSAGEVGFGDVVYTVQEGLAEIPWGHLDFLDHDSGRSVTLVEALAEVYEVVLVAAGTIGSNDNLAAFADLDARLVLVGSASPARLEACRNDAKRLGFRQIDVLPPPSWQAAVA